MKLLSNAHTHTVFCDGKNTPEEMIRTAVGHGFVSLGFSIHGWTPYESVPVTPEKEAAYKAELKRLRDVYAGQIELMIGIESDSLYERSFDGYEYRIDSTHYIKHGGALLCIDHSEKRMVENVTLHCGGSYETYCKSYYAQLCNAFSRTDAQICGHIDLVTKYNEGYKYFDEADPKYLKYAFEAADCAVERGLVIEINTGAIARGYRTTPYPSVPILRHIREKGGEIMINSDCHNADAMTVGFEQSAEIAKSCGFDHVLRLRAAGFEEVPLE